MAILLVWTLCAKRALLWKKGKARWSRHIRRGIPERPICGYCHRHEVVPCAVLELWHLTGLSALSASTEEVGAKCGTTTDGVICGTI